MKVSFALFNFALIFYCVYSLGEKWKVSSKKLFWGAFLFRLSAGITLGLIYSYYYSAGDTWSFFNDAKIFSAIARHDCFSYLKTIFDFGEDQVIVNDLINRDLRSIFFIKIISIFCLLSLDNYWVCAAYFSLLGFSCAWMLHRKITSVFPDSHKASALAFLFFPSVVFWSSGMEKESIALCGIYFVTIGFLTIWSRQRPGELFWFLALPVCFIVWSLKYYWMIVFFISIFTALVTRFLEAKFSAIKKYRFVIWGLLFFGIGALLSFTHPNFYFHQFLEVIVSNYNDFAAISNPKNLIYYFHLSHSWTSIIINSPWALLSGLFRPVIGEGAGPLGFFASIENFIVLVLFFGALINLRRARKAPGQIVLLSALSYCTVLCVFLALSTPNFGTLSRYRVGFLPFFVFVIAYRNPIIEWVSDKIGLKRFNFN